MQRRETTENCTRLSLMTSQWPSEVHANFISPSYPGRRSEPGGGLYLKGVTFIVSVKCLYDDTNSLPTKYTVFKQKMAQKQNLFDIEIKFNTKTLITTHLPISLQFFKKIN